MTLVAMACAGGFLFGPQTLIGLFAMELAPPAVAGFAGSLVSVCSQVDLLLDLKGIQIV